jgi:MOSC domain-containing protein YiiM
MMKAMDQQADPMKSQRLITMLALACSSSLSILTGDQFRVGSAVVMVTEPGMPCYKLGIKFGRSDIIKRFLASEHTGFYFARAGRGRGRSG